jgi:hypothetical protein
MSKREPPKDTRAYHMRPGKRYPGLKGKVVLWAHHSFEEGSLYLRIRFNDQTELCWTLRTAHVIQEADLSDWTTGDCEQLAIYVAGESIAG